MSRIRLAVRLAILAAALLCAGASKAPAEAADRTEARFKSSALSIFTCWPTVPPSRDRYWMTMAEVRRRSIDHSYGVDYRGRRIPIFPATERSRGAVARPTLILERRLARHGGCAFAVPIFDGSGLCNLCFTDIRPDTRSLDVYQNFVGLPQPCEVVREKIRVAAA